MKIDARLEYVEKLRQACWKRPFQTKA